MAWVGVITNAGRDALDSYIATGSAISINLVRTGTGIVAEENMRAATSLQSPVTTGQVVEKSVVSGGVRIKCAIGPYETSYLLKEVGLYATITQGNETTDVMIGLFQNSDGVQIPSIASFEDYVLVLSAILDVANSDDLTIEIDPDAYVAMSVLQDAVSDLTADITAMGNTKVNLNQGTANAGKFLIVGSDGIVAPTTIPSASGERF